MKETIIALSGTVVGFLLGWIKEIIQSKSKLQISLKEGELAYYKQKQNSFGEEKTSPEEATEFVLRLKFDIFNIGKIGDGITDISICIMDNKQKRYFPPTKLELPYENKLLKNISFNVEPNKAYTVQATLSLENDNINDNSYIFKNVNLEPDCNDSLKIVIIAKSIKKKEIECIVEPVSILVA